MEDTTRVVGGRVLVPGPQTVLTGDALRGAAGRAWTLVLDRKGVALHSGGVTIAWPWSSCAVRETPEALVVEVGTGEISAPPLSELPPEVADFLASPEEMTVPQPSGPGSFESTPELRTCSTSASAVGPAAASALSVLCGGGAAWLFASGGGWWWLLAVLAAVVGSGSALAWSRRHLSLQVLRRQERAGCWPAVWEADAERFALWSFQRAPAALHVPWGQVLALHVHGPFLELRLERSSVHVPVAALGPDGALELLRGVWTAAR